MANNTLKRLCALSLTGANFFNFAYAEGPAVSETNGKVAISSGQVNDKSSNSLTGSITTAIAHSYGFQLDLLAARQDGSGLSGLGGHLFWRDPDRGLLGLYSSGIRQNGGNYARHGVEADKYIDTYTASFRLARQVMPGGDYSGTVGSLGLTKYLGENLALSLGVEAAPGRNTTGLGVEWQPTSFGIPGLSFSLGVATGSHGYDAWGVGVRYYFGSYKTLQKRHRTEDPIDTWTMIPGSQPGTPARPAPPPPPPPVATVPPPPPPPSSPPPAEY